MLFRSKNGFIETISSATGFDKKDVARVLNSIEDYVVDSLNINGEARIPGLVQYNVRPSRTRKVTKTMKDTMRTGVITTRPSIYAKVLYSVKNAVKR